MRHIPKTESKYSFPVYSEVAGGSFCACAGDDILPDLIQKTMNNYRVGYNRLYKDYIFMV
jgi:hypothetical protein